MAEAGDILRQINPRLLELSPPFRRRPKFQGLLINNTTDWKIYRTQDVAITEQALAATVNHHEVSVLFRLLKPLNVID